MRQLTVRRRKVFNAFAAKARTLTILKSPSKERPAGNWGI